MKTPSAVYTAAVLALFAMVAVGGAALVPSRAPGVPAAGGGGAGEDVAALRARGPEGLTALLAKFDADPGSVRPAELDAVAGQRDASFSRLYWYTDLGEARAAAKAQHKPILYLRLLGKLTDEYSCANSRFFRTVLYANREVSRLLREKFVLVWVSERPVPVLTIDYGDGRLVKRTITGNSIHYVLTPEGEVVDALPGLMDPVAFARLAGAAGEAAVSTEPGARATYVMGAMARVAEEWKRDVAAAGAQAPAELGVGGEEGVPTAREAAGLAFSKSRGEVGAVRAVVPPPAAAAPAAKAPGAEAAGRAAMGKRMVERPLTRAAAPAAGGAGGAPGAVEPEVAWAPLARLHAADAVLDEGSLRLMRAQNPGLDAAAMGRVVARFQEAVALDTVRDLYDFRRRILGWLADGAGTGAGAGAGVGLEDLNRRVYAELFLTPRSDPWLGLVPAETYSALGNEGVCGAPVSEAASAGR